jgi:hypothetical protein
MLRPLGLLMKAGLLKLLDAGQILRRIDSEILRIRLHRQLVDQRGAAMNDSTDEGIKKLREDMGFAMAAMGVAFAQSLFETGKLPITIAGLRSNLEKVAYGMQNDEYEAARQMLIPFGEALKDKKFFPNANS